MLIQKISLLLSLVFNMMSKLALHSSDVIAISNEMKIMLRKLLQFKLQNPLLKETVMSQYKSGQDIFDVCSFLTCITFPQLFLAVTWWKAEFLDSHVLKAEVVPEVSAFKDTKNVVKTFTYSFLKSTCSAAFKRSLLFFFLYH